MSIRNDDWNDANEMVLLEEQRRDGLTPALRVLIYMEKDLVPPLGAANWNRRQDLISAAPDAD